MITKSSALRAIKEAHPQFTDSYIMDFLNERRYETLWEKNNWEDDDMVCEFEEWYEYKHGVVSRGSY